MEQLSFKSTSLIASMTITLHSILQSDSTYPQSHLKLKHIDNINYIVHIRLNCLIWFLNETHETSCCITKTPCEKPDDYPTSANKSLLFSNALDDNIGN